VGEACLGGVGWGVVCVFWKGLMCLLLTSCTLVLQYVLVAAVHLQIYFLPVQTEGAGRGYEMGSSR